MPQAVVPNRNRNNRTAPEPNRRGTLETEPAKGSSRALSRSLWRSIKKVFEVW